jgi:hypothetical protein
VGCMHNCAYHSWTNGATKGVFVEVPVVLIRFLFLDVLSSARGWKWWKFFH